jgi:tRNA pseudouridine38-40 synthase
VKSNTIHNIKIVLEYDGENYQGWQRQSHAPSIQKTLEDILSQVLEKPTVVYGSSRTDSGVHAKAQVANFYSEKNLEPMKWMSIFNTQLPKDIRVIAVEEMKEDFHSQKKVHSKVYEYRILNRPFASALDRHLCFLPQKIDWHSIQKAMPYFLGEHDFKSFQGAGSTVKTTVRKILRFELYQESEHLYRFEIEGSGFLKQMVRAIIGTLLEVGEGKRTVESIPEVIAACDRQKAGRTAPASGLCLVKINYK